jgi:hypothetical protein
LKYADGTDVDDGFKDFVREQASELQLSPAATTKLAEELIKHNESGTAAKTADETAAATKALEQLRQSWGPNYEANKVIADNAYAAMMAAAGFDQPTMTAAIQQLGRPPARPKSCRCSWRSARSSARTSSSAAAARRQPRPAQCRAGQGPDCRAESRHDTGSSATSPAARPRTRK